MSLINSFAPVSSPGATTLILGSMPGERSLRAHEYYAHPRNMFWPFMGSILNIAPELPYKQRLEQLTALGFALWDVMQSCYREGSLDADIKESSILPNDFSSFFAAYPTIKRVFFNGAKAEAAFNRYVLPQLALQPDFVLSNIYFQKLPSTSPANASISIEKKLQSWREIYLSGNKLESNVIFPSS